MKNVETNQMMPEISIILPCFNEAKALPLCLREIQGVLVKEGIEGIAEIIIVDNGSNDGSFEIAERLMRGIPQLRVIRENRRGYGSVYMRGLSEARGKYIFMADADHSYDFNDIPRFIQRLKAGADLVVGNRFVGGIDSGAMPVHHKYLGNPVLSLIVKKLFGIKIGDIHCGIRAMTREAFKKITLYTTGMEFASEMIVKVAKQHLRIEEIPVHYRARIGESKLESVGDGWRHLRFILLYSPIYLFFIPGIILCGIGCISLIALYFGKAVFFNIQFYIHPMFLSAVCVMLGYQVVLFAGFARIYAITHLGETDHFMESLFKKITIEKAGFLGIFVAGIGALIYILIFSEWVHSGFGSLDQVKNSILALTCIVLGVQTFFSAFMLSILGIREK